MSNATAINNQPSSREIARIEKHLTKVYEKLLKYAKEFERHKMVINPPRICMKPPSVPDSIWSTGVTHHQETSFMLLPSEIMRTIWRLLEQPADRIAFALTCKSVAALHSAFIQVHTWGDTGRNMDKKARLALLVRMRPVVSNHYRLCFACPMYRPVNLPDWEGPSEQDSMNLRPYKMAKEGSRCIHCSRREKYKWIEHKHLFQQYKSLLSRYSG